MHIYICVDIYMGDSVLTRHIHMVLWPDADALCVSVWHKQSETRSTTGYNNPLS